MSDIWYKETNNKIWSNMIDCVQGRKEGIVAGRRAAHGRTSFVR
jgi:hypothetical protein